uniref:Uncharacterized protein n=1 Tax=Hebei mivirus 1 TaxID=2839026 RepID=A0A8G0VS72_9VIRU|nr:MAG: hypothetical protein [Hebei mivirus 1]
MSDSSSSKSSERDYPGPSDPPRPSSPSLYELMETMKSYNRRLTMLEGEVRAIKRKQLATEEANRIKAAQEGSTAGSSSSHTFKVAGGLPRPPPSK